MSVDLSILARGIPLDPLPELKPLNPNLPHAPKRPVVLNKEEFVKAVQNALRYFPKKYHELLAPEFANELKTYGHIYMYRFYPTEYEMKAYPLSMYPAKCQQAACIQLMIMNNLDARVAQFPQELVTYGGNGSVFSNWAQYHMIMYYLSHMTEEQTLSMYSGHPMGLFPSYPDAPRMVITNGMVIPHHSTQEDYEKMYAQGVTIYGQMTAGSYCYIGPQGIVHGTTITVLNAGRKYLHTNDLAGKVYVTSGLGGMSGAQGKASLIAGAIGVIAEIDPAALEKRFKQGWISEKITDLDACIERIKQARAEKKPLAIGFLGNVVDLWERLAEEKELLVELGSDQTSLHNPWLGGYYPVQLTFEESRKMMHDDPPRFKELVRESLRRQVAAINKLAARGMSFWDYGNSFLLEASQAGADVMAKEGERTYGVGGFRYPSYVQDIMGDIFSLGFGPFRWVCTSGLESDLRKTDEIATKIFREYIASHPAAPIAAQLADNLQWIEHAEENKLVVGSQARILYADCHARMTIAREFNKAVARGELTAPVVISRDHHDVSGTDSPFRETSNITDGSAFCADMAVQNCIGDALRGATWVALHNGGGVGWGEVINGGFGMVLDGRKSTEIRLERMLFWDVNNGVARRAWSGNKNALLATDNAREVEPRYEWTDANWAEEATLDKPVLVCLFDSHFPSAMLSSWCGWVPQLRLGNAALRFFSKRRITLPAPKPAKQPPVKLPSYSKLREIAKRSLLPLSHVTKALCTREGKFFYLTDVDGQRYCFHDERDVIVPYEKARTYLEACHKETEFVEVDPEFITESMQGKKFRTKRFIVSVVGEMDHGKTTLLDCFQHTANRSLEYGGTTQIMRATEAEVTPSLPCTFLDTPGQSCFSTIRENGSVISDLTLYVISLVEGPSEEARAIFQLLHDEGTPTMIVFTKRDLVTAERAASVIASVHKLAEASGVSAVNEVSVSSVSGDGMDQLRAALAAFAEDHPKSIAVDVPAEATILDSTLAPSQGIVFRSLIQQGTLHLRDAFICGLYTGRVRSIRDLSQKVITEALPGMVVSVTGAHKLPPLLRRGGMELPCGDTLFVRRKEEIEAIWEQRMRERVFRSSIVGDEEEEEKTGLILVADNANSMNTLVDGVSGNPRFSIVHTRVGQILQSDVDLCNSSNVMLVSFNVPSSVPIKKGKLVYSRLMSELLDELNK